MGRFWELFWKMLAPRWNIFGLSCEMLRHLGAAMASKNAKMGPGSWKDEFWTIVLAVPLFCLGYSVVIDDPTIVDRVRDSFNTLDTLPDWYQYLLFLAVSASFGIRGADKLMKLKN